MYSLNLGVEGLTQRLDALDKTIILIMLQYTVNKTRASWYHMNNRPSNQHTPGIAALNACFICSFAVKEIVSNQLHFDHELNS